MRTLVIETTTEACSVALFDGDRLSLLDHRHEILGRGHAERLVPMIAELPDKGRAGAIRVSLGPGSFTGLRIGLAAARALGIAWRAEVLGYPTLSLVAARSWQPAMRPVTVCMNGGHGEWFVQNFDASLMPQDSVRSLTPDQAQAAAQHPVIAGNRAHELAALLGKDTLALDLMPDAEYFPLLNSRHLTGTLTPLYGRAPDAKLPK
ncbi:MAG: tRNA (adenosine(37)-N6)-threonylcarbamoyltransferase complex dimerization subunit type 1 TsaB [Pontixanthobacter sp.]